MFHSQLPAVDAVSVPADGFLLDVRENGEWAAGHARDALHIPMGEVVSRIAEVPDGRRVHVVCRVGGRSAQVAQYLIAQGVDAVNVDGGMLGWEAAGRPLVSDNDGPAFVL
ncbi:rhodanese-like domain-containing protein [Streptomyces sp. H10-C2]|uniref:rhodanese-like domain-containing protein n=1 Tax=unclassified Streptomyces TaxID=2593676 RepID=UPI0024BB1903|nr:MULTISPECIES: rhodanese-like domain-containing protein [unclassified Streptomyces]MDJ0340265.1 rhodanese-like domain-containing protein [Streptomyces sp. PH10-H1]MDJ0368287.1 rhodanese-like domain-containing protein [Streptomyces sp. H10-C2]